MLNPEHAPITLPDFTDLEEQAKCAPAPKLALPESGFWVFAYGSLMWNPGFEFEQCERGTLHGYHRRLCLWSTRYRGNKANPGLVLGLDQGGLCQGFAFKVGASEAKPTAEYLYQREMVNNAYAPKMESLHLDNGQIVSCLAFVSKPDHPQFAPRLDATHIAWVVSRARGQRGENSEYVINCANQLTELSIRDQELHQVADLLTSQANNN